MFELINTKYLDYFVVVEHNKFITFHFIILILNVVLKISVYIS
jgi:hypothetical protein